MDVNTSVSPALHPSNVSAISGYDDETADSVADLLGAFGTAYESLTNVHAARKAASENPSLTEAAQILVVADYADKTHKKIAMRLDAAHARLKTAIADGDRQLSQQLEGGSAGGWTSEVRTHVRSLPPEERGAFMHLAIRAGDTKTLAAVLGAPSYLSGLTPVERDLFTRNHHERTTPVLAKRLRVMKAAQELIYERSGLLFSEMEKAVGASSTRVGNLRAARGKAEKAYTFTP